MYTIELDEKQFTNLMSFLDELSQKEYSLISFIDDEIARQLDPTPDASQRTLLNKSKLRLQYIRELRLALVNAKY